MSLCWFPSFAKAFYFDVVPIVYFAFVFLVCDDISRKMMLRLISKSILAVFSSSTFIAILLHLQVNSSKLGFELLKKDGILHLGKPMSTQF